ncbi:sporulation membrane protein YtaF [Alkalibacillus sp. S2W]|uniref:sporulation membrane protein YtaF n=1 Tax=Alkalibacillus sp. S2W TaxID=3386553 RepID=UPI00398D5D31
MVDWIVLVILISFAVSFDSFFFGLTYQLRRIKLPVTSIVMIGFVTAISFLMGHILGQGVFVTIPSLSEVLGGFIFVAIGTWVIWQWVREQKEKVASHTNSFQSFNWKTIWEIMKQPQIADRDQSGAITGLEAIMVAIALSLDSFASGIGSAFVSIPIILAAIMIGLFSVLFLLSGLICGRWFQKFDWIHALSFLPGLILISLGFWNFLR